MSERKFILIVEDEPDAARLVAFHLQRAGYQVGQAGAGQEALNAAFESRPDLIILDLMLPKLDGFEVCRMLKTSPISRHVPILMVTALAATASKIRGFSLGADDYLTKPFEVAELLARIKALLSRAAGRH
jgi:DNA-binding response OmpR family regulator